MRNNILLNRICQLISQTYAEPYEKVMSEALRIGIDATIEAIENKAAIKF